MSVSTTAAREAARKADGRFGEQEHSEPELDLEGPVRIDSIYSELDRAERKEAMEVDLMAAVKRIVESDELGEWLNQLSANSGMANWSFRNRLIATLQTEERRQHVTDEELAGLPPTPMVMTARRWNELGRTIRKGDRALWIFAPSTIWKDVDDPNHPGKKKREKVFIGVRPQAEFDICQTEGDPVDVPPAPIALADHDIDERALPHLYAKAESFGYTVRQERISANLTVLSTLGYTTGDGTIVLDPRLTPAQKASTLIHEIAHQRLGHTKDMAAYREHRGEMETEAEAAAYLVKRQLGFSPEQSETFSAAYIGKWSQGDPKVVERAIGKAMKAASEIGAGYEPAPVAHDRGRNGRRSPCIPSVTHPANGWRNWWSMRPPASCT